MSGDSNTRVHVSGSHRGTAKHCTTWVGYLSLDTSIGGLGIKRNGQKQGYHDTDKDFHRCPPRWNTPTFFIVSNPRRLWKLITQLNVGLRGDYPTFSCRS